MSKKTNVASGPSVTVPSLARNVARITAPVALLFLLSACQTMGEFTNQKPTPSKPAPIAEKAPEPIAPAAEAPEPMAPEKLAAENLLNNQAPSDQMIRKTDEPGLILNRPITEVEKTPIRIAVLLPLTGAHKKIGSDLLKAANIALFDHNNVQLKMQPYDTNGTAAGASAAATAAIGEGAEIILGPLFSGSVKAVRPIAAAKNINVLAFSTDVTAAGGGVYLMGLTAHQQINRVLDFAYRQGLSRFAVIAPQNPYGNAAVTSIQQVTQNLGLTLDQVNRYPANLTPGSEELQEIAKNAANYNARNWQLKQELKKVKGKNDPKSKALYRRLSKLDTLGEVSFEAIIIPEGGQKLRELAPLLSYYDIDPTKVQFIGTGLWADNSLTTEPSLVGGWFAAPAPQATNSFQARFKSIYGYNAPHIASLAYDALALSGLLALEPGENKFSHSKLQNPDGFSGYNGIFRFNSNGLAERGLAVMQLGQQELELLEAAPTSFAPLIN
ncbi:MAG: penicillin-binding protein activator [Pseudomonas marincola]